MSVLEIQTVMGPSSVVRQSVKDTDVKNQLCARVYQRLDLVKLHFLAFITTRKKTLAKSSHTAAVVEMVTTGSVKMTANTFVLKESLPPRQL